MTFFIGLLMFVMVLVSVALIFLVLIQLPKKDAGAGVAFGGGATDALFGAGSGNVLTKVTKYAAIAFFGLALLVGTLQSHNSTKNRAANFQKEVEQQSQQLPTTQPAPATAPAAAPVTAPATTPVEAPAQK
jgi:preprotein translocase subunit SecG